MTQKRLNDLVYVHYNLKLRIKKSQLLELPGPLDLDEIDPYSDWTAQEPSPLFTPDEIADLERQAMEGEANTDFQFTMDDIEDEDEDDDDSGEDQALPLGGDASSSRTPSQSVGTSSEGAQPQSSQSRSSRPIPVRGTSSRTRPPRFPASASGKRKM